ncbi:MAG: NlpC/P60 family protein [Deltaproteobacteria bacterium]
MKYDHGMIRIFIYILPLLLLVGCSTLQKSVSKRDGYVPEHKNDLSRKSTVKSVLYSQYEQWKNVKYKKGGLSKRGVDCSGFVYPRLGKKVSTKSLRPGDLVFFKTGLYSKHVGIYLDKRKFIHASTSLGVTISSLDDYYWSKKYWKSVRISNDLRLLGAL